jgi:RNA polymerase sigma factor (TIGR02999 family)
MTPRDVGFPAENTETLFNSLYDELRLAAAIHVRRQRPGATITPTVLTNEACIRLLRDREAVWQSRAHFFGSAQRAMRHAMADYWRNKYSQKGPGNVPHVSLDRANNVSSEATDADDELRTAIARLQRDQPRAFRVVMLRIFHGFKMREIAEILRVSPRTVERDWEFAIVLMGAALQ